MANDFRTIHIARFQTQKFTWRHILRLIFGGRIGVQVQVNLLHKEEIDVKPDPLNPLPEVFVFTPGQADENWPAEAVPLGITLH